MIKEFDDQMPTWVFDPQFQYYFLVVTFLLVVGMPYSFFAFGDFFDNF